MVSKRESSQSGCESDGDGSSNERSGDAATDGNRSNGDQARQHCQLQQQ